MKEDTFTNATGWLDATDGHRIWWMDWGNPKLEPIFYLHGGPGSKCSDRNKAYFDPKVHRVIFHDQRGCGQSTPFGETEHNTTQDLADDIDRIRLLVKADTIRLYGGSWGSCLALYYAITHPKQVSKMLLCGIYTGTKAENEHLMQGALETYFPDAWQQFIEVVPMNRRNDTVGYYFEQFHSPDPAVADEHVRRWVLLEGSAVNLDSNYPNMLLASYDNEDTARTLAILEAYYFIHDCFLTDNFILKNADKIAHIPAVFVQSRQDFVCPPITASRVAAAIGKNCHLQIVPGGHHPGELAARETLRAYAWSFLG